MGTRDGRRPPPARRGRGPALWLFLAFFSFYAVWAGGHTYSSDEEAMLATTRVLLERGSPALRVGPGNDQVTPVREGRDGRLVALSGLAQSVVAMPLYLLGSLVGTTVADAYADFTQRVVVGWTNSLVTAAGVALVFLTARQLGARARPAATLAAIYGAGTMAWPHAKTLFSEPLVATLVLGGVYFAFRGRRRLDRPDVLWSGGFCGAALLARPSAALFPPLVAMYLGYRAYVRARERPGGGVAREMGRAWALFGTGALVPVAVLLVTNWWRFGSALDLGYTGVRLSHPPLEGLYGLFLSPGKSIFLYAPVAAVGLVAIVRAPRPWRAEIALLAALGLSNAAFFARFPFWHGDHSWGPRYLIMSLPFLVLPIAPLLQSIRWRRAAAVAGVAGVASAGLGAVMYFNQYFAVAEAELGPSPVGPEGPAYWKDLHFKPYWSPIAGHARALGSVATNTVRRMDGKDRSLVPFPSTIDDRYGWYFAPPQADSWAYWLFPAHGPKKLLVFLPAFAALGVGSGVGLRRSLAR